MLLLCSCASVMARAAGYRLSGKITDSAGVALAGASVSLLHPADSTLAAFGISTGEGQFAIADARDGSYLLQVAYMGYYTLYREVTVSATQPTTLGTLVLQANKRGHVLNEVVISGEKVPVRLKGDTLEYNAGSFKVPPGGVVEDLLRKLPGVQVDNDGNVKAMGRDVSKVLVDGKPFFGDDPKMAIKNLPADAVDKVQSYEKRTDESLFAGIDDGQREQTLNLQLKEGKKAGYFGEATAGLGLPEKYDASVKAFQFRPKSQFAAMGMFNNVNKFGFTFEDFINFNGGLGSLLSSSGRIDLNSDDMPIDMGQPVTGKVSSGAAGLNYTIEPRTGNRVTFNYMGSGAQKLLQQLTTTNNYTPNGQFDKHDEQQDTARNMIHKLGVNWHNQVDSANLITANLYGQLGNSRNWSVLRSQSLLAGMLQNDLYNRSEGEGQRSGVGGTAKWVHKMKGSWPVLQARLQGTYTNRIDESRWRNQARYLLPGQEVTDRQYLRNHQVATNIGADVSVVRALGKGFFLEPSLGGTFERENNQRTQGPLNGTGEVTDSLSPAFFRDVLRLRQGLGLRKSGTLTQWNVALQVEELQLSPVLNGAGLYNRWYTYLLPDAMWQHKLGTGRRLSFNYRASVKAPSALQLLPVTDYSNPLLLTSGNPDLKPEYTHRAGVNLNFFDEFSMSSFFVSADGTYTLNPVGWSRTIQPDLVQRLQAVNTDYATEARLGAQYSRPVRKLGTEFSVDLTETWTSSQAPVNGVNNLNNTLAHKLSLSFSNLNNNSWEYRLGGAAEWTSSWYNINRELNNRYSNFTAFGKLGYRPTSNWYLMLGGDMTYYTSRSFDAPVSVPLFRAEVSRYLLRNQRGTITLSGFDLLNRNKSVLRTSQLNYLMEQRSNTIGRYFMLSFSYRLNKAGRNAGMPGVIEIK